MSSRTFRIRGNRPIKSVDTRTERAPEVDAKFQEECNLLRLDLPDGKEYVVTLSPEGYLQLHLCADRLMCAPASSNTFHFHGEKDLADV